MSMKEIIKFSSIRAVYVDCRIILFLEIHYGIWFKVLFKVQIANTRKFRQDAIIQK